MPSATFTQNNLARDGPVMDVQFAISTELEQKHKKENKPLPKPIPVKALVDTGASHSIIQKDIIKQLGLEPVGAIQINTPSCKAYDCYKYPLRLITPTHKLALEGTFIAAPLEGQAINCLIGRDILAHGILIYIGYANQFTLSLL